MKEKKEEEEMEREKREKEEEEGEEKRKKLPHNTKDGGFFFDFCSACDFPGHHCFPLSFDKTGRAEED